jgi:hypothetical protein
MEKARVFVVRLYERLIESRRRAALSAVGAFLVVAAIKFTLSGVLVRGGATEMQMRTQDAFFTGLFVAIIAWGALSVGRFRREQMRARVKVVSDLNHHLRNALSMILNSHFLPENAQTSAILDGVERIDRALRHIIPGDQATTETVLPGGKKRASSSGDVSKIQTREFLRAGKRSRLK